MRDQQAAGHAEMDEELGWRGFTFHFVRPAQGHDDGLADASDLADG